MDFQKLRKIQFRLPAILLLGVIMLFGCTPTSLTNIQSAKLRSKTVNSDSEWIVFDQITGSSTTIKVRSGIGEETLSTSTISLGSVVSPFNANSLYQAILANKQASQPKKAVLAWINSDHLIEQYYVVVTIRNGRIVSTSDVKSTFTNVSSGIRLATNSNGTIILGSIEDSDFANSMCSLYLLNSSEEFETLAVFDAAKKPQGSSLGSAEGFQMALSDNDKLLVAMSTTINGSSTLNPLISYVIKSVSAFDPNSQTAVSSIGYNSNPLSLIQCRSFSNKFYVVASNTPSTSQSGSIIGFASNGNSNLGVLSIPNQASPFVTGTPIYSDIAYFQNNARIYYNVVLSGDIATFNYLFIPNLTVTSLGEGTINVTNYDFDSTTDVLDYVLEGDFVSFFYSGSLTMAQYNLNTNTASNQLMLTSSNVSSVNVVVTPDGHTVVFYKDSQGNTTQKTLTNESLYEDEDDSVPASTSDRLLRNFQNYAPIRGLRGVF